MTEKHTKKSSDASKKHGSVLVVGGGISGIQSALDLADAGFKVYIVERGLSIGGTMTQLDKTFPTNDCAMCILAPKLVYTGRHENIRIITNAEITGLSGDVGNFQVTITKHPRFVDLEKCNGCGDCVEHCPVSMVSSFDEGLSLRKAIYQPFPQAIPNVFAIHKTDESSPCRLACPAGLNAQGFIALAAQKKYAEAFDVITQTIPLPGSLGRICYHPCEGECNRKDIEEPVSICRIRRFIADYVYQHPEELKTYRDLHTEKMKGKSPLHTSLPKQGQNEKVAIIGAGPAGLTAAADLVDMGYKPTIFEMEPHSGGMLQYGVPEYRLPKQYLNNEIDHLKKEKGFEIKNGLTFGKDFSLADLRKQGFSAILLAIGAWKSKALKIICDHELTKHVLPGVEYLHNLHHQKIPHDYFSHKYVAVIGGGNVAMDSARTARRLGGNVTIIYRRSLSEMPAHREEIQQAQEEGIQFIFLANPQKLYKKETKTFVQCERMELGPPDASGRRSPVPIKDSGFDVECDYLIPAIGQELDTTLLKENHLTVSSQGFIHTDSLTLQTSQPDVFAAGDAVSGPASAVEAIAAGHQAACSIDRFLRKQDLKQNREHPKKNKATIPNDAPRYQLKREQPSLFSLEKRMHSFSEIDHGFTAEQVVREAQRCLNCAGCCECYQCVMYCGRDAIDHVMPESTEILNVGSVILSPGFNEYTPKIADSYGYKIYPNVLTSIEFERMLSASGPFKGHIQRLSDKKPVKKIAWLQCVGSRDESCDKKYCSSVCCMYATKEAVIAQEHQPGLQTHVYFMDMRSFGKDFDRYYTRAEEEYGVVYRRCRIPGVEQERETKDLVIRYVDENGEIQKETYDMVVLSVGLQPCAALGDLSKTVEVNLNEYGFVETEPFTPLLTTRQGVYASGTVTEPKDIPESVTQASAAAAEAAKDIADVRGTEVVEKVYPTERDIKSEQPKIGVFVCHCGINIAGVVDIKKVVEASTQLPYVVYADDTIFTCSQDSQLKIKEKVKELGLNRVVIASCTPRTHEPLFQDTLRQAGLNPHLFEMANLRDQNSWVHKASPQSATEKAIDAVRMAVAKAADLYPVRHQQISVVQRALVIGGGVAGMNASLGIADQGYHVFLVEKEPHLGGHTKEIYLGIRGEHPQEFLSDLITKVTTHKNIQVYNDTIIDSISGYVGNFKTLLKTKQHQNPTEVEHGVIIVATGAKPYTPSEYHYGKHECIITQSDFEKNLFEHQSSVKGVKELVMIQCVGSRNDDHPYCSRICCSQALKNALEFKEQNPNAVVYILYRDIRTYGFREDILYAQARKKGIIFICYPKDKEPEVSMNGKDITVKTRDHILGRELRLHPDTLVLSTGIIPGDNTVLAQQLKVPLTQDGFYAEAHVKLRPVDFSADGIFVCGLAHSPRFLDEAIVQAKATSARAATILSRKHLETIGNIAHVTSRNCAGCKLCIEVCPYDAITFDEDRRVVVVNEILCQGCGGCAAICPSGASKQNTFTKRQILSMIDACMEEK